MFCDGTACVVFLISPTMSTETSIECIYFLFFHISEHVLRLLEFHICFRWLMTSLSLENLRSLHFKFKHLLLLHVRGIISALYNGRDSY